MRMRTPPRLAEPISPIVNEFPMKYSEEWPRPSKSGKRPVDAVALSSMGEDTGAKGGQTLRSPVSCSQRLVLPTTNPRRSPPAAAQTNEKSSPTA